MRVLNSIDLRKGMELDLLLMKPLLELGRKQSRNHPVHFSNCSNLTNVSATPTRSSATVLPLNLAMMSCSTVTVVQTPTTSPSDWVHGMPEELAGPAGLVRVPEIPLVTCSTHGSARLLGSQAGYTTPNDTGE